MQVLRLVRPVLIRLESMFENIFVWFPIYFSSLEVYFGNILFRSYALIICLCSVDARVLRFNKPCDSVVRLFFVRIVLIPVSLSSLTRYSNTHCVHQSFMRSAMHVMRYTRSTVIRHSRSGNVLETGLKTRLHPVQRKARNVRIETSSFPAL